MSEPIPAFETRDAYPKGLLARPEQPGGASLKAVYDRNFRVVRADTDDLRAHAFRLRYQVYCIENAFEPAPRNPGRRETDEYDRQSRHSLLVHGREGAVVGTVRLILPRLHSGELPLPIQRVSAADTLAAFAHRMPAGRVAEISRFAITRQFRRGAAGMNTITGAPARIAPSDPARLIPHISLGLMQAVLAMAIEEEVSHLCAVMEPTLLRMLQRLGIYFEHLGPAVEYHGHRQPCFCAIDDLFVMSRAQRPDVWAVLTDDGRLNPHFSYPPWSARRYPADRAGETRSAMPGIGQAARRTLSAG